MTCGAWTMQVPVPRVNDRRVDDEGERQRFTSRILPPYLRRSPKVAEVLPILYLRGLSTGDFREALPVLLGEDAAGLSATNIARLTASWEGEYEAFRHRDLTDCDYVYVWVYVWADGIHFNIRLEDDRLCTLVVIGVRADGTKELVAIEDGYRESAESWSSVLRDLRRRGMRAPAVAVGDGALGDPVHHAEHPQRHLNRDGLRARELAGRRRPVMLRPWVALLLVVAPLSYHRTGARSRHPLHPNFNSFRDIPFRSAVTHHNPREKEKRTSGLPLTKKTGSAPASRCPGIPILPRTCW